MLSIKHSDEERMTFENPILCVPPKRLLGLSHDAAINISSVGADERGIIDIVLQTDKTVLFVVLTSLSQGRFDDNAFHMAAGTKKVRFIMLFFWFWSYP